MLELEPLLDWSLVEPLVPEELLGELAPELGVLEPEALGVLEPEELGVLLELEEPGVEEAPLELDGLLLSLDEEPADDEGELPDEDGVLLDEDGGVLLEPADEDGVLLEPADEEEPGELEPVAELPVFDFDDDAPVALSPVPLSQPYSPPTATARGISANADFLSSFMYSSLKSWRGPLCVARFGPAEMPPAASDFI